MVTETSNPEVDKAFADAAATEIAESLRAGQGADSMDEFLAQLRKEGGQNVQAAVSPEAAEIVTLYHGGTGAPHPTPLYMLPRLLARRFPREDWVPEGLWGKPVFTRTPTVEYVIGKYSCMLNPINDEYKDLEAYGVTGLTCTAKGIPTLLEFERHMASKHPSAWKAIEREKGRKREDEYHAKDNETRAAQLRQAEAFEKLAEALMNQNKPVAKKVVE